MSRNNVRKPLVNAVAHRALKDCRVEAPEVPVERIVTANGLVVQEGQIPHGWGFFHRPSWSIRLSPTLFQESPQNRNRRRFTLAHELGHCLLEHGETSCWILAPASEPAELSDLNDLPDVEREAHLFARELLLPPAGLEQDWAAGLAPETCARRYGVSRETLFIVLLERDLLMRSPKRR